MSDGLCSECRVRKAEGRQFPRWLSYAVDYKAAWDTLGYQP